MTSDPTLTTPVGITEPVAAFCADLSPSQPNPQYVSVEPIAGAETRNCFENVNLVVSSRGGDLVYGWLIFELPSIYLEAHHHAVWRTPEGKIIDVTPTEDGERRVLFLSDSTRPYVVGRQERRRMYALSQDEAVQDLVAALDQLGRLEEKCYVEHPVEGPSFVMNRADAATHDQLRYKIAVLFQKVLKNVG